MEHVHSRPTGIAVAGHSGALIQGPEPGQVSKLVSSASSEISFYENFSSFVPVEAERFFAKFFGTRPKLGTEPECEEEQLHPKDKGHFVYIVMEDLTFGFNQALPLDVKMGFQTYEPSSPPEKAARQEKTDLKSTSRSLGLRLTGYKHVNDETGELDLVGKDITFGISTKEEFEKHLLRYFSLKDVVRKDAMRMASQQIQEIAAWHKNDNNKFRMYSASLLLVWDAASEEPRVRVRLIDMAHVIKLGEGERDDNVIGGMENIIKILEVLSSS